MDCKSANELMMKYMDGILPHGEQELLDKHLAACDICNEDFAAYAELLEGFGDIEIIEAPVDFAQIVMAQVAELDLYPPKPAIKSSESSKAVDYAIFAAFVFGAAVFSAFAALVVFRYAVYDALTYGGYYSHAEFIGPITFAVADFVELILHQASIGIQWLAQNVSQHHSLGLVLFVALLCVQLIMHRKRKGVINE